HGQCSPLQALDGNLIDAIIVGGIGAGAINKLNTMGIKVYQANQGTVKTNLDLFKSQRFSFASLSALLNFIALYALIFLTPFYMVYALHYSILKVGLVMAAAPIATLVVAPLSGTLSDRFGTRVFAVCGMAISALGLYFLSGLDGSSSAWDVIWRLCFTGLGLGIFQSPNNSAIMGSVPPWHRGIAGGILAAMRTVGMVMGIAIAGAILYNLAPAAAYAHPGSLSPEDIREFLTGLHWSYISGACFAGMSALTSLLAVNRQTAKTGEA
ncbi:MAG: MFS transporter, partial [Dehalococcoidia bacterium]